MWKSTFNTIPIILIGLFICFFLTKIPWYFIQRRRVLLLCKTDHQALLKAGRDVLGQNPQNPRDRLNSLPDGIKISGDFPVPNGVQIPQTIWDLKPRRFLMNYDGYLSLEVSGNREYSFGVNIYPDGYKEPYRKFKYGDRELIPGLWYYDYGYLNNTEYDKKIDELIEKHKKKK